MIRGRVFLLLLSPLLVLAWGCNKTSSVCTVSGKVTYLDKPVTAGTVTFFTEGSTPYNCPIKADGTYASLGELPVGEMTVIVNTETALKSTQAYAPPGAPKGAVTQSPLPPDVAGGGGGGAYVKIPPKYKDPKKSGLKATLTKGSNTHDINLTD